MLGRIFLAVFMVVPISVSASDGVVIADAQEFLLDPKNSQNNSSLVVYFGSGADRTYSILKFLNKTHWDKKPVRLHLVANPLVADALVDALAKDALMRKADFVYDPFSRVYAVLFSSGTKNPLLIQSRAILNSKNPLDLKGLVEGHRKLHADDFAPLDSVVQNTREDILENKYFLYGDKPTMIVFGPRSIPAYRFVRGLGRSGRAVDLFNTVDADLQQEIIQYSLRSSPGSAYDKRKRVFAVFYKNGSSGAFFFQEIEQISDLLFVAGHVDGAQM